MYTPFLPPSIKVSRRFTSHVSIFLENLIMKKLKILFENEFLLLLISAVILDTIFMALVLTVYQGAPEVLLDSGLVEILEILEG